MHTSCAWERSPAVLQRQLQPRRADRLDVPLLHRRHRRRRHRQHRRQRRAHAFQRQRERRVGGHRLHDHAHQRLRAVPPDAQSKHRPAHLDLQPSADRRPRRARCGSVRRGIRAGLDTSIFDTGGGKGYAITLGQSGVIRSPLRASAPDSARPRPSSPSPPRRGT